MQALQQVFHRGARARTALGVPHARRTLCASAASPEFTLAPYSENSAFGFSRGEIYCLMTLRHPAFVGKKMDAVDSMYDAKAEARQRYMDDLFAKADTDRSGSLDHEQLKLILSTAQLPSSDDRVKHMLSYFGEDSKLDPEQFRQVLEDSWGGRLTLQFRADLAQRLDPAYDGDRATVFVGRSQPTHQLLRCFRHAWPAFLETVAIMRNVEANPGMNPAKMEIFQDLYLPMQPDELSTIYGLLTSAAVQPGEVGGFSIRLRGPGVAGDGDEVFVPLRILEQSSEDLAEKRTLMDQLLHTVRAFVLGCSLVGFGLAVLMSAGGKASKALHSGDEAK